MLRTIMAIAYVVTLLTVLVAIIVVAAMISSGYIKIGVELETELVFNLGAALTFVSGFLIGFALNLGPKARRKQTN